MSSPPPDSELKARHRAMWASGDYPLMVETFLLPLGPALVEACGIGDGMSVLDVAAGTGNASIPAAESGANVTASDLTPELLEAGRARAESKGLELEWAEADAENLPFEDGSVRRRHVVDRRDVRAPSPGGRRRDGPGLPPRRHDRDAELDPRGDDRRLVPDDGPVRAAASSRRSAAAALGRRGSRARAVRRPGRVAHAGAPTISRSPPSSSRATTASTSRPTTARRSPLAPTRPRTGARASSTRRSTSFCDEWNLGAADDARFEQEYLVAVGTRA